MQVLELCRFELTDTLGERENPTSVLEERYDFFRGAHDEYIYTGVPRERKQVKSTIAHTKNARLLVMFCGSKRLQKCESVRV